MTGFPLRTPSSQAVVRWTVSVKDGRDEDDVLVDGRVIGPGRHLLEVERDQLRFRLKRSSSPNDDRSPAP